ncbi:MAG: energy-coupling factor ABC transporter permease [Thermoplasmata archaeon]|nr:energy-coupling factor ABC transporter permease [Thermoplasmata archaeon]
MHIPDGLMDPMVSAIGWIEFMVVIAVALLISGKKFKEKDLPRIAVLSAGIFVAQMLNFPIGGGTTGHLVGAALFAILAGPVIAMVGMTVILLIQALMFGDGGITAFGLNATNMAIIAPLTGWGVYTLIQPFLAALKTATRHGKMNLGTAIAIGVGAWASVFVSASACAAELAVSYAISDGAYGIAATVSIPAMLGYHVMIAIGEAMITVAVAAYVLSVSPNAFRLISEKNVAAQGLKGIMSSKIAHATVAVLIVFALALPLYFMYSSEGADGLEKTMEDAGVDEGDAMLTSPFEYGETYFAALFAGILGFVATALVGLGLMNIFKIGRAAE